MVDVLRALKAGDELTPLVKEPVSRVQLVRYAGASGDFNPIHWDPERGAEMGLGGVIAPFVGIKAIDLVITALGVN